MTMLLPHLSTNDPRGVRYKMAILMALINAKVIVQFRIRDGFILILVVEDLANNESATETAPIGTQIDV